MKPVAATPPLGVFADHEVRDAFDRLVAAIDREHDARQKGDSELCDGLAELAQEVKVHEQDDRGRFALLEQSIGGLSTSLSKLEVNLAASAAKAETAVERVVSTSKGDRRWVIGQALGLIVLILAGILTMRDRLQSVEARQDQTDKTLDRLERRLEGIGDRLGVPAPAPPP